MVEVELKFRISDIEDFRQKLRTFNVHSGLVAHQTDVYFNHDLQDFAKKDLALRIRNVDNQFVVTFKGPNRDETAKIREEIEVDLPDANAAKNMKAIFEGCGYFVAAKVVKRRETCEIELNGHTVQACIDEVEGLGEFVELEIVVGGSEHESELVEEAKQCLLQLAAKLDLSEPIITSYLDLISK